MNHSNLIVDLGKSGRETKVTVEGKEITNVREVYVPNLTPFDGLVECMITVLLPVINTINDDEDET